MAVGLLIIAHAPLAGALRQAVLHVFPDDARHIVALDIDSDQATEQLLAAARSAMAALGSPTLIMTDVIGATPCGVAQRLVDGAQARLIAGVNLPMLLRAMTYRGEPLDALVTRVLEGGVRGIVQLAGPAPGNQGRNAHDQDPDHHQQ